MIGGRDWRMENQSIFGIILILTALANAVSSIVAWISKIRWSKEYKEAKDETIKAKEAEIHTLREHIMTLEKLNPQILKEWYQNGLKMAQTYVAQVDIQLEDAQKKIEVLERDKLHNRDLYQKAVYAIEALKGDNEKLSAEVTRGMVPTWTTVATSAARTDTLARITSTEPPAIKNELLKFYDASFDASFFGFEKKCPKCGAMMALDDENGKFYCGKCGHWQRVTD